MGHALMENRDDLFVGMGATPATGKTEVPAAKNLLDEQRHQGAKPNSLAAYKGCCTTVS